MKALIEKGADLTTKFSCGQSALDFAKNVYREESCTKELIELIENNIEA